MNLRKSFSIFFLGIMAGLSLSPLVNQTPQQVLLSPISPTLAYTRDFVSPIAVGEVLGLSTEPQTEVYKTVEGQVVIKEPKKVTANYFVQILDDCRLRSATIAVVGDSMTDTMGKGLPYLKSELDKVCPNNNFKLLNYGVGATNIEAGIARLTDGYQYNGEFVPSLISASPDVVILESFAYNPWGEEKSDLDRYWSGLTKAVEILTAKTQAKLIMLATIAPNSQMFGQGPGGVNWPTDIAYSHSQKIKSYLENSTIFAREKGIPLVDIYHRTLLSDGEGDLSYINAHDHIHPSVQGHQLKAKMIVEKLQSLAL